MQVPRIAVGGVIIQGEKILMVKRSKSPNKGNWAIPGGKVEYGETVFDALRREMMEETGLNVIPEKLMAVVEIIKEGFHYVILDFICSIKGGELRASSDALDAKFIDLNEIKDECTSPTTLDMLKKYYNGEPLPLFITEISK
ncbi:DNA mismatch repair protein MutT [Candidatus Acidianus copahuensis]|uniref:DNA mismatch repair protein MutT n=1 Tax=Candidatus Acidianus copahuensis TaxID=1160895 RepID=A0A031LMG4_9CREN|nr:NUDIX hydrolase [Candidatus Acidianus copahuensis]EZQ02093.1 DNA mismatch repair protein MutT [Candidatus Acidianus copahuensis]